MENAAEKTLEHSDSDVAAEELTTYPGELYVRNAHKAFGVTKALNGASFSGNFGEIHAIIGGNGCGKSTMAKVLAGVLPIDSGKVSIKGHHPSTPGESRSVGVAMVFQEVLVADEASIVDNLFVGSDGLFSKSMSDKEKEDKARELMSEMCGEPIDPLVPAGTLPLNIKAWITICRGFLSDPDLLILDESTAALDFDSTERLFKKMREMRDAGTAIIIVTHRIAELVRVSDRCTVMRDGKDVGVLVGKDINEENLLRLMTGKSGSSKPKVGDAHQTTSTESAIKTRNMKVWGDGKPVDFDLLKGEIIGVTGLDGHGQDDFCRVIAGVANAANGYTMVRKKNSHEFATVRSLEDAKAHDIAFVSGDRKREGILPNMSIFENLLLPLYKSHTKVPGLNLIDWFSLRDVFDWEVERLAIKTGPKDNLITSLSGGNQQKVMLGRAFATHPRTMVLLDPARGIDLHTKRDLYQQLREFASEGSSAIYMSAELEEFIGFCSRVLVFRNGSIFEEFRGEAIEPDGMLESMFGRYQGPDGSHEAYMERMQRETAGSKKSSAKKSGHKPKARLEAQPAPKQVSSDQQSVESKPKAESKVEIQASHESSSEANVSKFNVSKYFKDEPRTSRAGTGDYSSSDEDQFEKLMASNEAEEDILRLRADKKVQEKPDVEEVSYSGKDARLFDELMAFEKGGRNVSRSGKRASGSEGYSDDDERRFQELMQPAQKESGSHGFASSGLNRDAKNAEGRAKSQAAPSSTVGYSDRDEEAFNKLMPGEK